MTTKISIHCHVSGKVQGVWFRASTKEEAEKLGLKGWVRNLPDGRVEVFASGDADQIAAFRKWLQRGPELAKVIECLVEEVEWQEHDSFSVL